MSVTHSVASPLLSLPATLVEMILRRLDVRSYGRAHAIHSEILSVCLGSGLVRAFAADIRHRKLSTGHLECRRLGPLLQQEIHTGLAIMIGTEEDDDIPGDDDPYRFCCEQASCLPDGRLLLRDREYVVVLQPPTGDSSKSPWGAFDLPIIARHGLVNAMLLLPGGLLLLAEYEGSLQVWADWADRPAGISAEAWRWTEHCIARHHWKRHAPVELSHGSRGSVLACGFGGNQYSRLSIDFAQTQQTRVTISESLHGHTHHTDRRYARAIVQLEAPRRSEGEQTGLDLIAIAVDTDIHLWRDDEPVPHARLRGHGAEVSALVALTDGRLASACGHQLDPTYERSVRIWARLQVGRGACATHEWQNVLVMHGHEHKLTSLIEVAPGRLASSSFDGTVRVWDLDHARSEKLLPTDESWGRDWTKPFGLLALTVTPDGSIVSAGVSGIVRIW